MIVIAVVNGLVVTHKPLSMAYELYGTTPSRTIYRVGRNTAVLTIEGGLEHFRASWPNQRLRYRDIVTRV